VALAGETVTLLRSELRHCIKDALVTATSDENIEETRQAIEKLLTIADAGADSARPASQATRRSPDSR
jgi:ribosomal protein L12E/L44/L45/RPP1/RPP2